MHSCQLGRVENEISSYNVNRPAKTCAFKTNDEGQVESMGIVYYVSQIHHVVKMLTLSPASEKSS